MKKKPSNFIYRIRTLNGEAIAGMVGMITVFSFFIAIPFFGLYMVASLLIPSERYPHNSFELTDITLVKVSEVKKKERLKRIVLSREVDKKKSDDYIRKLNALNKDRFEFSDIKKMLFLRGDIEKINYEKMIIDLSCNTGIFKVKRRRYEYGDNSDIRVGPSQLYKLQFNAKNYVEIDRIATQVCAPTKVKTPY